MSSVRPHALCPIELVAILTQSAPEDAGTWFGWHISLPLLIAVVGEVLAAVFVVRVLSRGGSTASTLAWMLVILIAPWIGLALYYLLPRRIQLRRLAKHTDRRARIGDQLEAVVPASGTEVRGPHDPLGRLLCRLDPDAVYEGNQLTLLETGGDFVERVLDALTNAKRFVHLETYIFRPDRAGLRLLELLTATAARGVEVRLLYDSLGSWSLKRHHLEPLIRAGGHAQPFAPLLWRKRPFTLNLRNHRKLLVVDGIEAMLGGRNVGDEYATDHFGETGRWLDAMVAVQGPAVTRLHRVFVEDWYHATDEDLAAEHYFPPLDAVGRDRLGIVASGPDAPNNTFGWTLFHLIATAQRSLDISSPYLIPDPVVKTAMQVAAARGVKVRIHTNSRQVAQVVLHRAQRSYYRALIEAGIEITEGGSDYNHTKMLIADQRHLLMGSPNLDVRSTDLNFELAVVTADAEICVAAEDLFERRIAHGERVQIENLDERWFPTLVNGICRLASPLL